MKIYTKVLYFLVSLVVLLSGCSEFLEKSIEGRKVVLLAPGDNIETNNYTVNFWWEPVEDALNYRLQIVSPSFDSTARLMTDTVITDTKFFINLDPGEYSWRLRAENGSSVSLYSQRKITVHESSIINQQVRLLSPANNTLTNTSAVVFKWDGIFGAAVYRVQADTANFSNPATILLDNTTPDTEFLSTLTQNKTYQWRVRAEADTIVSRWSAINRVTFDNMAPAKVTLISPANNAGSASPVTFSWEAVPGAKNYELTLLKSDGRVYNTTFPLITTFTSYSFNGGAFNETINWKVRARDEAGNFGDYSEMRAVLIQ